MQVSPVVMRSRGRARPPRPTVAVWQSSRSHYRLVHRDSFDSEVFNHAG